MKTTNPFIKEKVRKQMLTPIIKCRVKGVFCRYAIPAYCLIEHSLYGCEYKEGTSGFKERGESDGK